MNVFCAGKAVTLAEDKLVAQGGEGSVYADGSWCYKVYHDRARALPEAKFRELAVLDGPQIVRPERLLTDASGGPVGYAMRRVKDPQDLPPLFTRSFRERKRVRPATVFALVLKLREIVAFAHARGVLVVDLNELNFLATRKLDAVWAIDVDSWQTPSYPATALMETVRDRHANKRGGKWVWTAGTDWFSFAVLATQLLVGIHPYRGRHPDCHPADAADRLEERMKRNLSVFNPKTVLPPPCFPIADVPPAYRTWLVAVLEGGERTPAPATGDAPVAATVPAALSAAPSPAPVAATGSLRFREVLKVPAGERVTVVRSGPSAIYVLTEGGNVYGGRSHLDASYMARLPAGEDHDLALTPDGRPLVVWFDPGTGEAVVALPDGTELDRRAGRPVVTPDGRVTVLYKTHVLELSWVGAGRPRAGAVVAAHVLEGTAALYPGVAVQRLLDAWYATVTTDAGRYYQVRLPASLDGRRVVDARYENRVLVLVSVDARTGRYDELLLRFDADHTAHDDHETPDVTPAGIAFAVTPKGVAVQLCDDGAVGAFRAWGGPHQQTRFPSGGRLDAASPIGRRGDDIIVAEGNVVYHLSLGKA